VNFTKFEQYIEQARKHEFEWGKHDCISFVNNCYLSLYNKVLVPEAVNRYTTEFGAMRALVEETGGHYDKLIDRYLQKINPKLAQKGDVVMYATNNYKNEYAVGICVGKDFCAVTSVGLKFINMNDAIYAWKAI